MEHHNVQYDMITQIAIYLDINVYQLFNQAFMFMKPETVEVNARYDYECFVTDGSVPKYVTEYCELVIAGME